MVQRASELDNTLPEVHITLGVISHYYDWDWTSAEQHYLRAIELDPCSAEAYARYAVLLVFARGKFDEAVEKAQLSIELDPFNPLWHYYFGLVLQGARRYADSIKTLKRAIELAPTSAVYYHQLGLAYLFNKMYDQAIAVFNNEIALTGRHLWPLSALSTVYWDLGKFEESEVLLQEILARSKQEYVQSTIPATVYGKQGRMDEAFKLLDQAYDERDGLLFVARYHPLIDPLRGDPRFAAFLKKMGFDK